jgi:hypothetical protein
MLPLHDPMPTAGSPRSTFSFGGDGGQPDADGGLATFDMADICKDHVSPFFLPLSLDHASAYTLLPRTHEFAPLPDYYYSTSRDAIFELIW